MTSPSRARRAACLLLIALVTGACGREPGEAPSSGAADAPAATLPADSPPPRRDARLAPPAGAPAADAVDPARIVQRMPDADAPTPAIAVGAEVQYACDDGTLAVTYRGPTATLVLPDGSRGTATLSVEASARSGGEVYVGDRLGLQRLSNVVELQVEGTPPRRCLETGGSA